jgi:hypothetical protein
VCHEGIDSTSSDKISEIAWSAVLNVLIMLDYEPRHEAPDKHQASLVSSHMRTAFSVPSHYSYLHSGYPSEPILAEAAAHQINIYQMHIIDRNVML